jgi:hypothetical protein
MTKSITITYKEADESVLMTIFRKFKIKTTAMVSNIEEPEVTKKEILNDLREAVEEMKAHKRGEIELPTWEDVLKAARHDSTTYA